ncbi:MAG: hypothetical protein IT537_30535 [Hyphomicrobiales bacterium]|nr:hypothetical protein [Hyphomicrobiales bacterium]
MRRRSVRSMTIAPHVHLQTAVDAYCQRAVASSGALPSLPDDAVIAVEAAISGLLAHGGGAYRHEAVEAVIGEFLIRTRRRLQAHGLDEDQIDSIAEHARRRLRLMFPTAH